MPIKGLTDRKTLKPSLPRLGKLRKGGEKVPTGRKDKYGNPIMKYGPDLDHFRFTSDDPAVVEAFHKAYSTEPDIINVILFYETVEDNFSTWIEAWDASGMVFRSDGENWIVWREGDQYKRGKKPHTDHPDQFEVGRLEVIIPELLQQGFVGTVTMETHSNHDLRNISSVLYAAEQERGSLRGSQFVLRRYEDEISVPGWGDRAGKRSKAKKWLVKLEAPRRLFDNLLAAGSRPPQIEEADFIEADYEDAPQWRPTKGQFFQKCRDDFQLTVEAIASILKTNGFTNGYSPDEAQAMYNVLKDFGDFADKVREAIPYYASNAEVFSALTDMAYHYDVENEQHLFDALATRAEQQADSEAVTD